jgi:sugar lactone lactonase YvrE
MVLDWVRWMENMHTSSVKLLIILSLIAISSAPLGCSDQTTTGRPVNDPCRTITDCADQICHRGICVAATPKDEGGSCTGPGDCVTHNCDNGICVAGTGSAGTDCRDAEECLSGQCLSGICADIVDGALPHDSSAPRDGGIDGLPPTDANSDAPKDGSDPWWCNGGVECPTSGSGCSEAFCTPSGCDEKLKKGFCFIDGKCYADGDTKAGDICQGCLADDSTKTAEWSYVNGSGCVTTLAGAAGSKGFVNGSLGDARFDTPTGLCLDEANQKLYIADSDNNLIRIIDLSLGVVGTFAGDPNNAGKADGSTDPNSPPLAQFKKPTGIALTSDAKTLYVADQGNHTIRRIALGQVATYAGKAGSGDYVNGPRADARFEKPSALALDANGSLFVVDTNNDRIAKIDAFNVSTAAGPPPGSPPAWSKDGPVDEARFNRPGGIHIAATGTIYIADTSGHIIREIANEMVKTIAPTEDNLWLDVDTSNNEFRYPAAVITGGNKAIYVADTLKFRIRKLDTSGTAITIKTVAGSGTVHTTPPSKNHADGKAETSLLNAPVGMARAANGQIYIADSENHVIRVYTP